MLAPFPPRWVLHALRSKGALKQLGRGQGYCRLVVGRLLTATSLICREFGLGTRRMVPLQANRTAHLSLTSLVRSFVHESSETSKPDRAFLNTKVDSRLDSLYLFGKKKWERA